MVFTSNLPLNDKTLLVAKADNTDILTTDPIRASLKVRTHLAILNTWFNDWKILVDSSKSPQISFNLHSIEYLLTYINNTQIPMNTQIDYLV